VKGLFALAVVAATFFANAALACPNCVNPKAANQKAFVASTLFLSFVPFFAVGAVIFLVIRTTKKPAEVPPPNAPLP
jgi:hypothetical protein